MYTLKLIIYDFDGVMTDNKVYVDQDGKETVQVNRGENKTEINFKDGKKEGIKTEWYENGQKSYEETWKNGKENGLSTIWYENGQIQYACGVHCPPRSNI